MASSSSSRTANSHRRSVNGTFVKFRNESCYCRKSATVRISESTNNPNRLYFKCESGSCKFFKFWEPEMGDIDWPNVGQSDGCGFESLMMEVKGFGGGLQSGIHVFQSGVNGVISSIGGLKTLVFLCLAISCLNLFVLILK